VIFNLLDNALEASPYWVRVAVTCRESRLTIAVSDRGAGFDPGTIEEFGKPYRSTSGRAGSGLGLFLVVNVVRKLGGTVVPCNDPAGGAIVTVSLPLSALSSRDVSDV
jgi:two-component system sensor histidine kinase RegB